MATDNKKLPYYQRIANELIEQLKVGAAPWQVPWKAGEPKMPHNPISGTRYKGANALWLAMQGRGDSRWMTYKQAQSIDAQVKRSERGTLVQYWKLFDKVIKKDSNDKPMLDKDGKPIKVTVKLDKPKVFSAIVFNAEQIEGLPELETNTAPEWQRHQRAEKLIQNFGVPVHHDQFDNAYYCPSTDSIHLPQRQQFPTADAFYATILHECGHASGSKERLNRDLTGRFGDESYAKEELRAEIASLMLGDELQIGHSFGQHAAYVDHWIKVLQDDPKEILKASRDAEKIHDYLMEFENQSSKVVSIESNRVSQPRSVVELAEKLKVRELVELDR
ncbi:ArdC family protein [Parashewanella curva]|nr:zincin-like metallopeptidase domain-containing protein [Parashewanella curva]